jgi:transcriptional regulator with XRE-family HTH domain
MTELLGVQVRMARAALRWSIATLAKRAKVGISSVQAIEASDGSPAIMAGLDATRDYRASARAVVLEAIAGALAAAGVVVLPDDGAAGPGVRVKAHAKRK